MASLVYLRRGPFHPDTWKMEEGLWQAEVDQSKVNRNMVIKEMTTAAANKMWASLSPHEANSRLAHGPLELKATKRCHRSLIA